MTKMGKQAGDAPKGPSSGQADPKKKKFVITEGAVVLGGTRFEQGSVIETDEGEVRRLIEEFGAKIDLKDAGAP